MQRGRVRRNSSSPLTVFSCQTIKDAVMGDVIQFRPYFAPAAPDAAHAIPHHVQTEECYESEVL